MSITSENLIKLRIESNKSQAYIAKLLNKSQQSYSKYENDITEPDIQSLKILSSFYNVPIDAITGSVNIKGFKIPVLGVIPAGVPISCVQDILDWEEIDEKLARTGEFFALKVQGDSMAPKMLQDDIVIFRQQETANSGDVCVVMVNHEGDAMIKRIRKDNSGIMLVPDNPEHEARYFTNKQIEELPVKILGKAIEIRRSL